MTVDRPTLNISATVDVASNGAGFGPSSIGDSIGFTEFGKPFSVGRPRPALTPAARIPWPTEH